MTDFNIDFNYVATKRCEDVICTMNSDNIQKYEKLSKEFKKCLTNEQLELFNLFIDELNYIEALREEAIYKQGFKDGIRFIKD